MNTTNPKKITAILQAAEGGDKDAEKDLWNLVYQELRRLAAQKISRISPGQTLHPTELVHETYLRLIGSQPMSWDSRAHFFGTAARAMRNILVDRARKKSRTKHGGGKQRVTLNENISVPGSPSLDLLALDQALERLAEHDSRLSEITMLRFFAGLTIEETARILKVSSTTVDREWSYGKAWLFREMNEKTPDHNGGMTV